MLSCKEVSRLVSESLDVRLPIRQRIQIGIHLLMCMYCSRFRRQLLFLRDIARRYHPTADHVQNDAPQGLSDDAKERIKQYLRSQFSS